MAQNIEREFEDIPAPEVLPEHQGRGSRLMGWVFALVLVLILVLAGILLIWYAEKRSHANAEVLNVSDRFKNTLLQSVPDEQKAEVIRSLARRSGCEIIWFRITPGGKFLLKSTSVNRIQSEAGLLEYVEEKTGKRESSRLAGHLKEIRNKRFFGERGEEASTLSYELRYFIKKYEDRSSDGFLTVKKILPRKF